jgi:hypothetical protein
MEKKMCSRAILPAGTLRFLEAGYGGSGEERAVKEGNGWQLDVHRLAIWVADALIEIFFPAARRLGRQGTFLTVVLVLGSMSLALMVTGYRMRGEPQE